MPNRRESDDALLLTEYPDINACIVTLMKLVRLFDPEFHICVGTRPDGVIIEGYSISFVLKSVRNMDTGKEHVKVEVVADSVIWLIFAILRNSDIWKDLLKHFLKETKVTKGVSRYDPNPGALEDLKDFDSDNTVCLEWEDRRSRTYRPLRWRHDRLIT